MPAAPRPALKPQKKAGPSKKFGARSLSSIASSTARGTPPTFSPLLIVPPGATIRANLGDSIVDAAMTPDSSILASVRIRLEPLAVEFDVPRGASLVAGLAAHGFEFPCGGMGECGGCGVRVLSGSLPITDADRTIVHSRSTRRRMASRLPGARPTRRSSSSAASGTWKSSPTPPLPRP